MERKQQGKREKEIRKSKYTKMKYRKNLNETNTWKQVLKIRLETKEEGFIDIRLSQGKIEFCALDQSVGELQRQL